MEGLLNLPMTPEEEKVGPKMREGLTNGARFLKRWGRGVKFAWN